MKPAPPVTRVTAREDGMPGTGKRNDRTMPWVWLERANRLSYSVLIDWCDSNRRG